jgi:PEGA domain
VLTLDRFIRVPHRRLFRTRRPGRPRRHSWTGRRRLERGRAVLPALCAVGIAAAAGWMLAGGGVGPGDSLRFSEMWFSHSSPAVVTGSSGTPMHIDSSPSGAQVRIDGSIAGKTPLDLRLEPGQHTLSLQHPDALDDERTLQVGDGDATVDVELWRRRPAVLALRPVYPGASMLDARFLEDGRVALLVGLPSQLYPGAQPARREVWLLDPVAGQPARVSLPGMATRATTMVLAPDGDQVAYVTPGSAAPVTATGWSMAGSSATTVSSQSEKAQPETVWVSSLDGSQPRRIFELPLVSTPATPAGAEHVVDLAWTPDASRPVAITRQPGPPVRSRVLLLNVPAAGDSQPADADELVLLPAEVLPASAVPDPTGRWLALVTHAVVVPGGNNLLNLCVVELRPGGTFRDIADLGSGAARPAAAPVAWPPEGGTESDRLAFVGPAPAAPSSNGGLFGIFGALRPAPPPAGLFMADLQASGLQGAQPRRLGTAINNFGLVWRFETTLYGFARQDDGTLALHSIDPVSGAVHDLGVRLPAGIAQGMTGLSARWDARHGSALLLARAPGGGTSAAAAGGGPLQAWLVSFVSSSSPSAVAR